MILNNIDCCQRNFSTRLTKMLQLLQWCIVWNWSIIFLFHFLNTSKNIFIIKFLDSRQFCRTKESTVWKWSLLYIFILSRNYSRLLHFVFKFSFLKKLQRWNSSSCHRLRQVKIWTRNTFINLRNFGVQSLRCLMIKLACDFVIYINILLTVLVSYCVDEVDNVKIFLQLRQTEF